MDYLEKYRFSINEAAITKALQVIEAELPSLRKPEVWKHCFGSIDLTTLNAVDTAGKVQAMAEKINLFPTKFNAIPQVAAICVYPSLVRAVRETLHIHSVQIAAVGAGFPSSQTFIKVKCDECRMAVAQGATEIDMVISLGTFLAGDYTTVAEEIKQIKAAVGKVWLKVIIETGALTAAQIAIASFVAMEAGADFIKTSTGKITPAATPVAAWIMANCIKHYYEQTGKKTGFKPAGGIVESDDAVRYYAIVKNVLGKEWLTPVLFRLGASKVANNLLTSITGIQTTYF